MMRLLLYLNILFLFFAVPSSASDTKPLHVGFLVLDRVYNSELMAPYDIFHHTVFHTKPGMKVFMVSPHGKTVTTFEGLRIETEYFFATAPPIDILVIPSAEHNMDEDLKDQRLKKWVREKSEAAQFVVT